MHPFITAWFKRWRLERDYLLWYDARDRYDALCRECEEMMNETGAKQ